MAEVTLGIAGPFSHGRVISQVSSVANPAAGAGFTITIAPGYWERGLSLSFVLTTDDTDATRIPTLTIKDQDGAAIFTQSFSAGAHASGTVPFTYARNVNSDPGAGPTGICGFFPDFFLIPTWTVNVGVANLAAADQISAIRWYRERFITGDGGYEIGRTYPEDLLATQYQVFRDRTA